MLDKLRYFPLRNFSLLYYPAMRSLLRSRFWDVTQRSPQRGGAFWGSVLGERCVTSQKTAAKETKQRDNVTTL